MSPEQREMAALEERIRRAVREEVAIVPVLEGLAGSGDREGG